MHIKIVLFVILVASFGQSVLSQPIGEQGFVVTNWGMKEGLPQSSVNEILQTRDGYLWLATYGGLVRFDGVTFTTFDRSNTKEMRSDRVLHLYEDRNDAIWLSTEDGLLRFKDGEFITYLIKRDSQVFSPSQLFEDNKGELWVIVNNVPYRLVEDVFVEVGISSNLANRDTAIEDTNEVWLSAGKKILRTWKDSVVQVLDLSDIIETKLVDFKEFPERSGTYFIGTLGDGVLRYKNGEYDRFSEAEGLPSQYIWKFDVDKSDNLWVTSYNGQSIWNNENFVPPAFFEYIKDIQPKNILEDEEGNYWIGTSGNGLYRVRPSVISTISGRQGLLNSRMLSLTKLSNGSMLFATNCGGVYQQKGHKVVASPINTSMPNQCVWSVFEDSKKNIWYGSVELFRSNISNEPGKIFNISDGFTGFNIYAITEDSNGNIWIGCFNGVFKYDGKTFKKFSVEDGLAYNDTRVFYEDELGVMWIGSSAGLSKIYPNGEVEQVRLINRDANDGQTLPEPYVRAIYKDSDGVLWLGTYGTGIYRLAGNRIKNIRKTDGLFDDIVSHLLEDENGTFWMGSNRGIFQVSRQQLNDFSAGTINQVQSVSYGIEDGMLSAETNGGFQPSAYLDTTGYLYFPTVAGVAVVNTNTQENRSRLAEVRIEHLRGTDGELQKKSHIELPYNASFLEIKYTAIYFTDPHKVRFRYRLLGLNDFWIDVGSRREALYTKIPPGDYTFEVIASNKDGIWNQEGAAVQVTVVPPYWQTTWFYILIGFLFISVGPTFYWYRINRLKKENERQKYFTEQLINSQEGERRRIASELHDGLGQQILVIKNRAELAKMQLNNPVKLAEELDEIVQSSVVSIAEVRTISHDLRPVHLERFGLTEALMNLGEQLQETSTIDWSFYVNELEEAIPKENEIHLYRVIQEGVNNILKHAEAQEASLFVKRMEQNIVVTLWDDGKGFSENKSAGIGFLGMQERVDTLRGTLDVESLVGDGTSIKIVIPIQTVA